MESSQYASIAKRALSFTIDDIIISFLFIAIIYNQLVALSSPEELAIFLQQNTYIILILKIIYHTLFIGIYGKTIGKYVVKIKAVDENGYYPIGLWRAFIRALVRTVGEMLFFITFIVAFFDPKRQTLHDRIGKCVVVNE